MTPAKPAVRSRASSGVPRVFNERYVTDFDFNDFCARHAVTKTQVARALDVSKQSMAIWTDQRRWPFSAFKAVVEAFAPDDAERLEMRQCVARTHRPLATTDKAAALAARFDDRRAGKLRMAFGDGNGFYEIPARPPQTALPAPATVLELVEEDAPVELPAPDTPLIVEREPAPAAWTPQPIPEPTYDRQSEDLLISMLTRVTLERNGHVIELANLRQSMADRDVMIETLHKQIAGLQQSIKEWEQLADRDLTHVPTTAEFEERVVARVAATLRNKRLPDLVQELQRLHPQKGHRR